MTLLTSKFEGESILLTSTTVPQVFRLKLRLMCVPLETPRHDELDRKSSSPPTRSLGTETVMELESHWTGTAGVRMTETTGCHTSAKGTRIPRHHVDATMRP